MLSMNEALGLIPSTPKAKRQLVTHIPCGDLARDAVRAVTGAEHSYPSFRCELCPELNAVFPLDAPALYYLFPECESDNGEQITIQN